MRKFFYVLLLAGSIACSNDESFEKNRQEKIAVKTITADEGQAANPANPFDNRGLAYLQLSDNYEALIAKPAGNEAIIGTSEYLAADLGIIDKSYDPAVSQNIALIKQLSAGNLTDAITGLSISATGQARMQVLLGQLTALKQQDAPYDDVYAALVNFELSIEQSSLPSRDTEVLLTTLSIVRYNVYSKSRRKRRDRDWELSVGNVMATAYGAVASRPNAIISAVAAEYIN